MSTPAKIRLTAGFILVLVAAAVAVDLPQGPDLRLGSWFREIKVHLGLDLKGGSRLVYDADVSPVPAADRAGALEGARDVIERRVNVFGVSEPLVRTSRAGGRDRIVVELAGVQDVNEAIRRIGETPLLEFREQGEAQPLTDEERKSAEAFNAQQRQKAGDVLTRALAPDADFAALAKEFSEDTGSKDLGGDIDFQKRQALVEPYAKAIFDDLTVGATSPQLVASPFGFHIIKKTDEREVEEREAKIKEVRSSHVLFTTKSTVPPPTGFVATGLTGKQLKRAQVNFDPNTGSPEILLQFNDEGTTLFAAITKRNLQQPVAIFLDGAPISEPIVQSEITTGEAVISGSFTLPEAKQLAQRLNAGALPVPITLVSQRTVGPTLGRDAVERSAFAGVLGLLAVAVFMLIVYRGLGLIALVSLAAYSLLTLAVFKLGAVTLTLAGVAGFVLSIGMAVDANILIFERIREELRAGRTGGEAIEEGFRRAWLSIRDSNVSSLITTFILAWFGTSIIKGFAITLAIGIAVSMFTAITVARTLLRVLGGGWLERCPWLVGARRPTTP